MNNTLKSAAMIILSTVLCLCACDSGESDAPGTTKSWGEPELIEYNSYDAEKPKIAIDYMGNAIAVWEQSNGIYKSIRSNRYIAGSGWEGPELIETDTAGDAGWPEIAFDPYGNAITVCHQSDGTRTNIWSSAYMAEERWGIAEVIESGSGSAIAPVIAFDHECNAIAVWHQIVSTTTNIYTNRYTAENGWGSTQLIENDDSGHAEIPQISIDTFGNAIVVWHQHDGTRYNIQANRYTAGGTWGTAQLIETVNQGNALFPQVTIDSDCNAIAVWQQYDNTRYNIWANRYTAGGTWGTAQLIETDNKGDAKYPMIACDSSCNAIAVWHQYDGTRENIWSNRYTAGSGWGTPELIETNDEENAYNPQIAIDP